MFFQNFPGIKGVQGEKGDVGHPGEPGELGDQGPKGDAGNPGKPMRGLKGIAGDRGPQGDPGKSGDPGRVFTQISGSRVGPSRRLTCPPHKDITNFPGSQCNTRHETCTHGNVKFMSSCRSLKNGWKKQRSLIRGLANSVNRRSLACLQ